MKKYDINIKILDGCAVYIWRKLVIIHVKYLKMWRKIHKQMGKVLHNFNPTG
jgi:hypothetical protein